MTAAPTETRTRPLPPIQFLWIGGALSTIEQLSLTSFVKNGHPVHLYAYEPVTNVPAGVQVMDGREILGADRIFKYKKEGSYAGFSNIFRYKLLLDRGNFWCDLDVVCLRPFDFADEYVFSGATSRKLLGLGGKTLFIQSCVIKCPPGSDIMRYCYDTASAKNPQDLVWGEIGPDLLQGAVHRFGHEPHVWHRRAFTILDWTKAWKFVSGSPLVAAQERLKIRWYGSYGVHLYNEIWRQKGWDKNGTFAWLSLVEGLKRRYL